MLAQLHRKSRFRISLVWLTVLTMLLALFPGLPVQTHAAGAPVSLSQSIFTVGYADTTLTLTGSDNFPLKPDTKLNLYSTSGRDMGAITSVQWIDNQHLTFTLKAGVQEGAYNLYVTSYSVVATQLTVLSSFDPTNIRVTPGVNRDVRFDWTDPSGSNFQSIIIKYGPITQQNYTGSINVARGKQTATITGLMNNTAYKYMITTRKADGTETTGVTLTNGGAGYLAVDSTPPGDITHLVVNSVPNGFDLTWVDPPDSDLNLITIQYAEHGTTQWSSGTVVQKGTQKATLTPMNTSKRYDLRFTKADSLGNLSYQIDNHGGYGYTVDTKPPYQVYGLSVSTLSDNSASLSWTDPDDIDFHHVNIYLRSDLTDWKYIGKANKGVGAYTLVGLAQNIDYTVMVKAVDDKGNESQEESAQEDFTVGYDADLDTIADNVTIAQEPQGGLKLSWDPDQVSSVDFNKFKMYYAPIGSTNDSDYRSTTMSGKTTTSAYLRAMPRGTYQLQMRLYDNYGIEHVIGTYKNDGLVGYYVSGNGGLNGPSELGNVRILPAPTNNLMLTWDAATTDGTAVLIYYAPASSSPTWSLAGKVDKRLQQYIVTGLRTDVNYFFKVVVFNDADASQSQGVVYNNSGYGYNVLGGDTHAPGDVTDANASVAFNQIIVTYTEPTDSDFDTAKVYVLRKDTGEVVDTVIAQKDDNGATLSNLLPNIAYDLKITTVDIYGNESNGIQLDNNGDGYVVSGNGAQSPNEVRNALLVPGTNEMTVRFQDPTIANYNHAVITIIGADTSTYTSTQIVYKGSNDVTFYGLDSGQNYLVHIATVTDADKTSPGIDLGGTTGVALMPIPDPINPTVTPGNNRLTIAWEPPINLAPTSYQVQVQAFGSNQWSDPMIVPGDTNKVVFHGLSNYSSYKVRIVAVVNNVSSPGLEPDNNWSGYTPHIATIMPSPAVLSAGAISQTISILGTNTQFPWSSDLTVQLFDSAGDDLSGDLSNVYTYGQQRVDVTLAGTLQAGIYRLVVRDPYDGELTTYLDVQAVVPAATLSTASTTSSEYGYNAFTMYLVGNGFTSNSKVMIDSTMPVTTYYSDAQHLSFTMPTGLLPGAHVLTVSNDQSGSNALGFNVYPFTTDVTLDTPSVRAGSYKANLTIHNLDKYTRSTQVLLVIRRNGLYMETKTVSYSFAAGESKSFSISFGGGAGSPYSIGATNNISVQAYVVDGTNLAPVSEPMTVTQDLNL